MNSSLEWTLCLTLRRGIKKYIFWLLARVNARGINENFFVLGFASPLVVNLEISTSIARDDIARSFHRSLCI